MKGSTIELQTRSDVTHTHTLKTSTAENSVWNMLRTSQSPCHLGDANIHVSNHKGFKSNTKFFDI